MPRIGKVRAWPTSAQIPFTKWRFLDREFYDEGSEPASQSYELPLRQFNAPGWPSRLSKIVALRGVGVSRPSGAAE